jgi:hypothetical protein
VNVTVAAATGVGSATAILSAILSTSTSAIMECNILSFISPPVYYFYFYIPFFVSIFLCPDPPGSAQTDRHLVGLTFHWNESVTVSPPFLASSQSHRAVFVAYENDKMILAQFPPFPLFVFELDTLELFSVTNLSDLAWFCQ